MKATKSPLGVSKTEVSLKVIFGSEATGHEYVQVRTLSRETKRCVSVLLGEVEGLEATPHYSRPSSPSHIAPRLYSPTGLPKMSLTGSPGVGGGITGPCQVCPPSFERTR